MSPTVNGSNTDRLLALPGMIMDFPLTVRHIIDRMAHVHGSSRVVTLVDAETNSCTERSFREVVDRAGRLAHALHRLGVRPGDRVGSLAWNSAQHLEVYLAVMGMGAVLHTMNLRLVGDQLAYTVDHAGDTVVIVDGALSNQLADVLPLLPNVNDIVVFDDVDADHPELPGAKQYEELLERESSDFDWPDLDERSAAALCYTSGSTGDPKGVLYSHRSIVLHALTMSGADVFGITRQDRVVAAVPLFHAMGWGLPFICGLVGAELIMPSRHLKPAPLAALIESHRATWSAGVPTVWMDLLHYLDTVPDGVHRPDVSSLRAIMSGGTAVPGSLVDEYRRRFGTEIVEGWGMTEIFPGATVGRPDLGETKPGPPRRRGAGRVSPMYELRVVDSEGNRLPHDGESVGDVEVRGPMVASGYYRAPEASAAAIDGGWLRTGDVGTVDECGELRITDRAKDVIKSGGEWISSQDLETHLMAHPAVREVVVVGVPDERWGERPMAFVVLTAPATAEDLRDFLASRVARWWIPEHFRFVDELERTATGKFDKKKLRALTVE